MAEIKDIATASIDPKSTVNVRRSQVKESVDKVKSSISAHGFWRSNPITIRLHPDSSSQYEYEVVIGQCRLKACSELGIEQIPAVIQEIDEDEAIRQSWAENEGRSDITTSDKAYWIHKIVTKYVKEGKTLSECREIAAVFFAMSVPTVIKYHPMAFLPPEVNEMLDNGKLRIQDAEAIAKYTYDPSNPEGSEQKMKERAEWAMKLNKDEKKECPRILEDLGPEASIDELDNEVKKRANQRQAIIEVAIPEALRRRLQEWGDEKGLTGASEAVIISHMVVMMLSRK